MIGKLTLHTDFTIPQIEQLVKNPQYNNQVGWVVGDEDLQDFYKNIKKRYSKDLEPQLLNELNELIMNPEGIDLDEEIPF
ncbi:MAG: hypothetical protein ACI9MJ_001091 [Alphaproteobacteria bacterium]